MSTNSTEPKTNANDETDITGQSEFKDVDDIVDENGNEIIDHSPYEHLPTGDVEDSRHKSHRESLIRTEVEQQHVI